MSDTGKLVRIGDFIDVSIGGTPSRKVKAYWDLNKHTNNVWLSIRDISNHGTGRISDSSEYITNEGVMSSNVKLIPANTALMTFKLTIGKTVVADRELYTNEAIAAFIPKEGVQLDPYYLATVLPTLKYDIDNAVKGKTLNKAKIENALIPIPPIKQQLKIATVLEAIDDMIQCTSKDIELTVRLKKSLAKQLFTKSSNIVRLGDYANISTGTTPATGRADYYTGSNLFVKTTDIKGHEINTSSTMVSDEAVKKYRLKKYGPGTVLLAMYGQGKTRGNVSILKVPASITQNAAAIEPAKDLDSAYLWQYMRSQYDELRGEGVQGHIAHLNLGFVKELQLPLPSIAEQQFAVSILADIDKKILINKNLKLKQERLKYGLAQALLSGRVAYE